MFKKILAGLLAFFAIAAFAAVDANKATQAELEGVKGIGPSISAKIIDARKSGAFKDWPDLIERVSGIGDVNAVKLSAAGLTVGGASYKGAAPAAKSDEATAAKASTKKTEAAPATDAAAAKPAKKTKAEAAPAADTAASKPAKKSKKDKQADAAASAASAPAKK